MNKNLLIIGSISGMLAVMIGAFGAHGLEGKVTESQLSAYETGVQYHFYHTFAIFIAAWLVAHFQNKIFQKAGWFFVAGLIGFSGSLYLLATRSILGIENWAKVLGPMTPIGGTLFIIGWGMLAYGILKSTSVAPATEIK